MQGTTEKADRSQGAVSRRWLLLAAGGTVGGLALGGMGYAAMSGQTGAAGELAPSDGATSGPRESGYGEAGVMAERVLVAYASRFGSTAGVADALGQQLAAGVGVAVDVRPAKDVSDLRPYRAVVIGSAINSGRWLPEALEFVRSHQSALRRLPTAYFLVCILAANPTGQNQRYVATFLEPARALVQPVAEGRFAGALWPSRRPFLFEGLGLRIFLASQKLAEGDHRNWDTIRAWADEVRPLLLG